jgi:hypothetical protein
VLSKLRAVALALTGSENPALSLSFWAVVILSGLPAALAQFFGIQVDATAVGQLVAPNLSPGERLTAILAILGIRRRLGK